MITKSKTDKKTVEKPAKTQTESPTPAVAVIIEDLHQRIVALEVWRKTHFGS